MQSCIELFEANAGCDSFADAVDAARPQCGCEGGQVSAHCTIPVTDEETLVRLVIDPIHLKRDEQGVRVQSCFLDQMVSYGASTLRLERAKPEEYHETARLLLDGNSTLPEGSKRAIYGIVRIPVKLLREAQSEIPGNGKEPKTTFRSACVYATGEEKRPSHADILVNCSMTHSLSRSKKNRIAANIANEIKNNIVSIEDFKSVVDLSQWQEHRNDDAGASKTETSA